MSSKIENELEDSNFKVIGGIREQQIESVKRVLPEWLSNPSIISSDLENEKVKVSRFESLAKQLDEVILRNIKTNHIKYLFPVQIEVIPFILEANKRAKCVRPPDVCVSAPTGSGKTLAYVVPIVHVLSKRVVCEVRALVVLPVKELALQVYKVFQAFAKGTELRVGLAVGEKCFQDEQSSLVQKSNYYGFKSKVDILVATPGRLVDHLHMTEGFSLKNLRFVVLDEADRLMSDSDYNWLDLVENQVYGKNESVPCHCCVENMFSRVKFGVINPCAMSHPGSPYQKLLFSATLSHDPENLQRLGLFNPRLYTSMLPPPVVETPEGEVESGKINSNDGQQKGNFVGHLTTPKELTEYILPCERGLKPLYVWHLMANNGFKRVLCFTNSVTNTHRLTAVLKEMGDILVEEYSSKLDGSKRKNIIKNFNDGKIDILVCSDAMARGMDLENVEYVFCYDLFPRIETYIHRIGRTARAGKTGTAINLLDEAKELVRFKNYMKTYRKVQIPIFAIENEKMMLQKQMYIDALSRTGQGVNLENAMRKKQKNRYLSRVKSKQNKGQPAKRMKRQ